MLFSDVLCVYNDNKDYYKIKVYALGIEGNETDLILTMIHGTSSVTTKAVEVLVVANIKEEDVILDLPRTFKEITVHRDIQVPYHVLI